MAWLIISGQPKEAVHSGPYPWRWLAVLIAHCKVATGADPVFIRPTKRNSRKV